MRRIVYERLIEWKSLKHRLPLILQGARQVGKTYLLEAFGANEFAQCHVFNFEDGGQNLTNIFTGDLSVKRLLKELAIYSEKNIDPNNDLLIFDEIQNCPRALTSLKYFSENIPKMAICCAGSLMGVMLSTESFPVGKVTFINLYPLNFEEFLLAVGGRLLYDAFVEGKINQKLPGIAHNKLWQLLKEYWVVGGMPKVVQTYVEERDKSVLAFDQVREKQNDLLLSFQGDFNKHSGKLNALHLTNVFENVPEQLAQNIDDSVKRYRFKDVIPKKRTSADLEGPISWLVRAGLLLKVKLCNRAELPFKAFCKPNIFKLYVLDIGLLGAMLGLKPETIIGHNYGITKGFFAENFVAQEFVTSGIKDLYCWTERNSEIEFLLDVHGEIIPVEVKSSHRSHAKSLQQFFVKYKPHHAVKISTNPLNFSQKINAYPLFYAGQILAIEDYNIRLGSSP